jgi:hypothetical protein
MANTNSTKLTAGELAQAQPRVLNHAQGMATVFHRNTPNWFGSEEGDQIDMNDFTEVARFEFTTLNQPIENPISLCFRFTNSVDSVWDEHEDFHWFNPKTMQGIFLWVEGDTESHRSTSVGDVVKFNNMGGLGKDFFFEVAPMGFRFLSME